MVHLVKVVRKHKIYPIRLGTVHIEGACLLTDPRLRWEPVDNDTALLVVPFGESQERFVVRFDPVSGRIQTWEVMRYKNGEGEKVLWINGAWFDEGSPWAAFNAEEIIYNVAVEVSPVVKGL